MNEEVLKAIREEIAASIKVNVNGKIDKISDKLDEHNKEYAENLQRILPVIEAFEASKTGGKAIVWVAGSVATIGGAWMVLKSIFPQI